MNVCANVCMYLLVYIYMCVRIQVCMYACMYVRMSVCMYVYMYVYMYACMPVCICTQSWKYAVSHRQMEITFEVIARITVAKSFASFFGTANHFGRLRITFHINLPKDLF